jgi:hypothetical protein
MGGCAQCDYYNASSAGYHRLCPKHANEAQVRVLKRDGNLDAYYAEKKEAEEKREEELRAARLAREAATKK